MEQNSDIKLLSKNSSLIKYFNEIIFGQYDDGELHNFLIINESIKNTFFIVSESNDENSISSFIKNNIVSNNLLKHFIQIPEKINEDQIIFSPTNYSLIVLTVSTEKNNIEINTLGIFEWLLSNIMFENILDISESLNLLHKNEYNLFALNYSDINKNFEELLQDENLAEIINLESIN